MQAKKLFLEDLGRDSEDAFRQKTKRPIHVVLDDIRSGLNVGSFFRTADGFAIEKISLCGITSRPPHKEILKTAIGAADVVDWTYYEKVESCLELEVNKRPIICIEQTDQSFDLNQLTEQKINFSNGCVLVFGNEVEGVSEAAIKLADYCCEIPQFGTKHSFNVSVCAGIILWEFAKQVSF